MHLQPTPGFHSTMPTLLQLGLSAGSNFLALSLQHCRGCTAGSEITTPCKRDTKALEMRSQGAQKQGHTAPGKTSCATQSAPNISPTLLSIFQNSLQAKIFMPHLNKFKTERGAHLQGWLWGQGRELDVLQPAALGEGTQPERGRRVGVGRQVHRGRLWRHRSLVLQLRGFYHAPHRHLCTRSHWLWTAA